MNTFIISGFPAIGKTYITQNKDKLNISCIDSDSSKFSWLSEGVRNPDFPNNYIEHIKSNVGKVEYIFVSSHKEVREALYNNNLPHIIVYPDKSLKEEYLDKYYTRGNNSKFTSFISDNWNNFIDDLDESWNNMIISKFRLNSKESLLDLINSDKFDKAINDYLSFR